MKTYELGLNESIKATIARFVNDPNFGDIRDAFISGAPTGAKDATESALNLGKVSSVIYVFGELDRIVKEKPRIKQEKKDYSEEDPDLKNE